MQISLASISKQKIIVVVMMVAIFAAVGIGTKLTKNAPPPPILVSPHTITLAGRGGLQPLHMVASHDTRLQGMIKNLSGVPASRIFTHENEVNMMVMDILFRWAEADMAQKGAYGPFIDSRVAAFLKKIGAVPASYAQGIEIPIKDATNLTKMWFKVFDHYRVLLLAQTAGQAIYDGHVTYDLNADKLAIDGSLSPTFIKSFQDDLEKSQDSGQNMRALLDFVDATKGFDQLTEKEQDSIMGVVVKKPAATLPVATQAKIGSMPGKANLPPVNAAP